MKSYYYIKYGNFGNVYNLYWAPADFTPPETWERISRKDAERYAAAERRRRKENPAFAYFADSYIWPVLPDRQDDYGDIWVHAVTGRRGWYLDGRYIIRRR